MDNNVSWYIEKQIDRIINNLRKRNMEGFFVSDNSELISLLEKLIAENSVIGVGDSMTLFETGVIDFIRKGSYIYIQNFSADTFLCSTNAITESGELYNIDGNGSRVAPMLYGPKQVILVAGINKIVKDIEEAEKRVRNYSAPIDAKRLDKDTPCVNLGYCIDCKSPNRICNDFVVIRGQFIKNRIKVIIVGKQLGY